MDPTTMHAGGPAVRIDALDMFVELLSQVEDDASSDTFYSRLCEATCALTSMERAVIFRYDEVRRRVRAAMEAVGLPFEEFKDRYTFGLSGGEMRKVALAGVLALEPEVLVLDEPTAGLDPRARRDLLGVLRALHAERGTALVFVSHNMDEVAELVSRVDVLADGKTVLSGPVREVFREERRLRELGLGVPAASELAGALRERGVKLGADVLTIDDAVEAMWTSLNSPAA